METEAKVTSELKVAYFVRPAARLSFAFIKIRGNAAAAANGNFLIINH